MEFGSLVLGVWIYICGTSAEWRVHLGSGEIDSLQPSDFIFYVSNKETLNFESFYHLKRKQARKKETAAEYVKSRLPEALKQHLQDYEKDKENSVLSYQTILEQQILSIDREMLEKLTVSYDEAGTTCLIALLSDKDLTVANVGDSRGVLCDKDGNAIPLSHDHKPYQLKERKRIKRAGGFISFNGSWRVQGILAMSRSLGDYPLKNLNVVIPDPDILTFDLDKLQPEFMILASDGLWDAFSNEEAVRFIKDRLDEPHFGAKSIVLQSFYRGCPDNITVMVVKFRNSSKTEEQ
ncbi:protein phosphatase 1L isoform X2 [Pseudorca crassidens]|uniref:protein phosphatase 1L isoform X2 n=1 Tax=Pseudorca crassidens TaxID=82174 RepID=UPI00352FB5E0